MKNVINTIQNKESFEEFINNDYIEALTNSGQRMGVAGHSVKYMSNNIVELIDFGGSIELENAKDYVVAFEYINSEYKYYYALVDSIKSANLRSPEYILAGTISDNKILEGNTDIIDELMNKIIQMGHIEKIYDDYILHYDDYVLTFIFKAKILNTNEIEYYYMQYNTNSNRLLHFIQIKKYDDEYYLLIKLEYTENGYFIDVHKFTLDSVSNYIKACYNSELETHINTMFTETENGEEYTNYFSILNSAYVDYDKMCNDKSGDVSSIVNYIINFDGPVNEEDTNTYNIYHFYNIPVEANDNNPLKYQLKLTGDTEEEQENIDAAVNKIKGNLGVDINELFDFIYYVSVLDVSYEYLLSMYNKYYYAESKNMLFLAIIRELYHTIYNSYTVKNNTVLFVPGNYLFNYVCNDMDELNIYYFNNINVLYSNAETFNNGLLKNNYIIYYDKTNEAKLVDYNISIKYNSKYANIIHSIIASKLYVYPYINQNDTWTINDSDSEISSYNNLNSIHKIFVLYVDKLNNDPNSATTIINHLDNADERYFVYTKTSFNVNPYYFSSYAHQVICETSIPVINDNNFNYFQNTLLLIITNKQNITSEDDIISYTGEYVYSLWTCTNDAREFKCVIDPIQGNGIALDPFGYVLEHKNQANNVLFMNADTNKTAHIVNNLSGQDFVVMRNKIAKYYPFDVNVGTYSNDFNFIIEYVNYLKENGSNTDYLTKHIKNLDGITVSNILYPQNFNRINVITQQQNTYEIVNEAKYFIDKGYNLYVDTNNNVLTEEYITGTVRNVENMKLVTEYEKVEVLTSTIEKSKNSYYNEYLPNTNVPLFDSKEILHVNTSVLNRVNIIGIGENKWYNGFIGTYFDNNTNKSVFGISTSNVNINVGTDTLFNLDDVVKFGTYETFRISGFNTIDLKAGQSIKVNKAIEKSTTIAGNSFNSISVCPIGLIYDGTIIGEATNPDSSNCMVIRPNTNGTPALKCNIPNIIEMDKNNILFIKVKYMYNSQMANNNIPQVCDCLYLNNLLRLHCNVSNSIIDGLQPESFNVGNNILLYTLVNGKYYFFMLLTTTDFDYYCTNDNNINNVQIMNSQLNVININNSRFNIRFNDSRLNYPTSGQYYADVFTNSNYAAFKDLLVNGVGDENNLKYAFDQQSGIIIG